MIAIIVSLAAAAGAAPPETTAELDRLDTELKRYEAASDWFNEARVSRKLYAAQRALSGDDAVVTWRRKLALASLLQRIGDYSDAVHLFEELLAAAERQHGLESSEARDAVRWLHGVYVARGDRELAGALSQRLLAITKKLYGETSTPYITELAGYGDELFRNTEYAAAQRAYERALQLADAAKVDLRGSLMMIGLLYLQTAQHPRAIAAFDRIFALERAEPIERRVSSMHWVAERYHYGGRDDLARPLGRQAIALAEQEVARIEQASGGDAEQLRPLLFSIGAMLHDAGDLAGAERVMTRLIAFEERRGGFAPYAQLAAVRREQKRPREALALFEKANAAMAKLATGPRSMTTGVYPMMADILRELGDHRRAEQLYLLAQADLDRLFGKRAIFVTRLHLGLVGVHVGARRIDKAERLLADNLEIAERELAIVLAGGTEADHLAYFVREGYQLDTAIAFNAAIAPTSASAARLALTTLLRRKGRVLDAAAASLATIRGKLSAGDRKLLEQLDDARAKLSKLAVAGGHGTPDYVKEVAALEDQIRKLEIEIGRNSAEFKTARQPVDLAGVQAKLPRGARLVEFVDYQPRAWNAPYELAPKLPPRRYAAYVVGDRGDPVYVDLGATQPIDDAIAKLRAALADPDNDRVAALGRAVHELTFGKLTRAVGAARHVLIAPDGALNLVPFAALHDGKRYLVQDYTFTYLTSGRDLLRLGASTAAKGGPILFADPDFEGARPAGTAAPAGRRAASMAGLRWPRLPGTGKEADAIAKTITGATVYRDALATEATLKGVHAPAILHLATHGFFLPDPPSSAAPDAAAENPLLRSGMVLAGANRLSSGRDDGILTALEATGLDLWGTKLVVMSACETGLGKISTGDGVYGLRRALVIAGAESLVMSLWQVDDEATRELMTGYYRRLQAGSGRSAALRDVQLELAGSARYAHPYYWASFVPAGDSSPLGK